MIVDLLRAPASGILCLIMAAGASAQSPTANSNQAVPVGDPQPAAATPVAGPIATPAVATSRPRENYRIGAGDVLELRVLGEPDMSATSLKVSADGFIQVPFVHEDVRAMCLTERELADVIAGRLTKFLKYPEVHVGIKEYNSIPVAIIGAVNQPGRFKMERRVSLLELLTYAGGLRNESGSSLTLVRQSAAVACDQTTVISTENEGFVEIISLKPLLAGDQSLNRVMRPGDIVVIPNADVFFVAGDVTRPNVFQLRDGLTFTQALAQAGGPTSTAKKGAIRIIRQLPGKEREIIPVDLKAIDKREVPDPPIFPNDVIEVPNSGGKTFFKNFFSALGGSIGTVPVTAIP